VVNLSIKPMRMEEKKGGGEEWLELIYD